MFFARNQSSHFNIVDSWLDAVNKDQQLRFPVIYFIFFNIDSKAVIYFGCETINESGVF
jgi:hypothetical protein